jgi:hypothetical protein
MSEENEPPAWATAALEEYKTHRAAYLESQASDERTLAFGATATGVLIAGAFNVWKLRDPLPATLLFLVVIPTVSSLVIVQWAGQVLQRRHRNDYLLDLEGALKSAFRSDLQCCSRGNAGLPSGCVSAALGGSRTCDGR